MSRKRTSRAFFWMKVRRASTSSPIRVEKIASATAASSSVTCWPSADIFETVEFDYETLAKRFQQMAFLNKGLRIALEDLRPEALEQPGGDDSAEPVQRSD